MYRQGDVLLVPTVRPKDLGTFIPRRKGQGIILAAGEATGHHHRVRERGAREYQRKNRRFLTVGRSGASVTHEEHDPLTLPQGTYEVVQQREYEPVITDNTVRQSERPVYD